MRLCSVGAAVIWRLDWGWRTSFQAHSCGCWHEASAFHHVGSTIGLLTTWLSPEQARPPPPPHTQRERGGGGRNREKENKWERMNERAHKRDGRHSIIHISVLERQSIISDVLLITEPTLVQWGRRLHKDWTPGDSHWGSPWRLANTHLLSSFTLSALFWSLSLAWMVVCQVVAICFSAVAGQ